MADIFLSYSRQDVARIQPLVNALTALGFTVWWDRAISAGERWRDSIRRELDQTAIVLALWSRNSVRSEVVNDEARYALGQQKLLPVQLDDSRPPIAFSSLHTLDLSEWTGDHQDPKFDRLVYEIQRRLKEAGDVQLGAPPASPAPAVPPTTARPSPSASTPIQAPPGPASDPAMPTPSNAPSQDEAVARPPTPPGAARVAANYLPPDVFVAYSRKDAETCRTIVSSLRGEGLEVFYDQFIQGGEEWREMIARSIKGCSVFMVLFSANSVASPQVRKEVNLATAHSKNIVPVMIEDVALDGGLELELSGINFIPFFQDPESRLMDAVEKAKTLAAIAVFDRRREHMQAIQTQAPGGSGSRAAASPQQHAPGGYNWIQGLVAVVGGLVLAAAAATLVAGMPGVRQPQWVLALAAALFFITFPYVIGVLLLFRRLLRS